MHAYISDLVKYQTGAQTMGYQENSPKENYMFCSKIKILRRCLDLHSVSALSLFYLLILLYLLSLVFNSFYSLAVQPFCKSTFCFSSVLKGNYSRVCHYTYTPVSDINNHVHINHKTISHVISLNRKTTHYKLCPNISHLQITSPHFTLSALTY